MGPRRAVIIADNTRHFQPVPLISANLIHSGLIDVAQGGRDVLVVERVFDLQDRTPIDSHLGRRCFAAGVQSQLD